MSARDDETLIHPTVQATVLTLDRLEAFWKQIEAGPTPEQQQRRLEKAMRWKAWIDHLAHLAAEGDST